MPPLTLCLLSENFQGKMLSIIVLGARTQGCAFLMSSENLKTPCLLGGSKQMSDKHLGLHNISSSLFIEKKVFLESTSYFENTECFLSFF